MQEFKYELGQPVEDIVTGFIGWCVCPEYTRWNMKRLRRMQKAAPLHHALNVVQNFGRKAKGKRK